MMSKHTFKTAGMVILFAALCFAMAACSPDPLYIRVAFIEGVPETGVAGSPLLLTAKVRPVFARNSDIIWLVRDAGTTGASISGNILNTRSDGTVIIRAIIANGMAEGKDYTQDFIIVFSGGSAGGGETDGGDTDGDAGVGIITSAAINVMPPAKGDVPNPGADSGADSVHYTIGDVSWSPDDNPFKGEIVYMATVTLTANDGYKFSNTFTAKINGNNAVVSGNTGTTVTISYTFAPTLGKKIVSMTITSQPAKMTYISGEKLDLSGLAVTLVFDEGSPEAVAYSNFGAYNILTVPAHDTPLTSAHNGQPITVTASGHSANTGNLTVIEPVTAAAVTVTPPAKGVAPNTTATSSGHFTAGAVSWSPNDNPFKPDIAYTATVTLTANGGYTFTGLTAATINNGVAAFSDNTGTTVKISYTFAKTSEKEITGITVKTQPTKLTYTNVETLNLSGLVVTFEYDDLSTEDIVFANFAAKGITTNPTQGTALTLTHNGTSVTVTASGKTANTGNLSVNKAKAPEVSFPHASAITYGAALSTSTLSGGTADRGTFAWQNPATIPTVTNSGYYVEFTPTDTGTYDYTDVLGWNGTKVIRLVNITVNPKSISITPTAGQSKVYGTADPAFTYTPSEALISGNSFEGTLAYTGTGVGTHPFTLGSLSAGSNYTLTLAGNVSFTITKASGSAVTQPSGTWNFSTQTITVTAVNLNTATGQDIEYAISTSSTTAAASLTWTANKLTFTGADGVIVDTTYYVYARSKENTNYSAGTPNVSVGITTAAVVISIDMVSISAGTFTMGSPTNEAGRDSDETQHSVTLSGFKMSNGLHPIRFTQLSDFP